MKFDFLYYRWVLLNTTENGRQIFLFRVPVVYAEKLLFFEASSQQSICHTPVYLHLGYRFLLGQIKISNMAVGREVKEISVSLLGEPGIHSPLCCWHHVQGSAQMCSPSWQQNPVDSEELGRSRWGDLYLHGASSQQTRTWWIIWMGCAFSCHWKNHGVNLILSYVQKNLFSCCHSLVLSTTCLICVEGVWIGFCICISTAFRRTH